VIGGFKDQGGKASHKGVFSSFFGHTPNFFEMIENMSENID